MTTLTPELLLHAYTTGHFPMSDRGIIRWYNPNPRGIIPLDERFHVPSRLGRTYRSGRYQLTSDRAFVAVMRACSLPRPQQPDTWIDDHFVSVYTELHQRGFAHSIEAWQDGQLVGGLYGVAIGGLFAGESMFSFARDASKVALIELVSRLRRGGFVLLDTQWVTDHLAQFGTYWMPQSVYLQKMRHAIMQPTTWIADN
ncbi:MAG: leucyl/phenylalanyl-tRNA--protein transferase [Chloroflexota bacterium]|jgi:leucyl/phenylalanyl-tRNA--protein transferase